MHTQLGTIEGAARGRVTTRGSYCIAQRALPSCQRSTVATSTHITWKWPTERKHLPDVDVAAAGGWSDTRALKMSYQHLDELTMYGVFADATKLRDVNPDEQAETA
jgi:hypothetical protein